MIGGWINLLGVMRHGVSYRKRARVGGQVPVGSPGWLALAALFFGLWGTNAVADDAVHVQIDHWIMKGSLGPVAAMADDSEFVRRVYLDLNGRVPSASQTRAFLADGNTNKRTVLIDKLLNSPEFARHFANVLDVMLMERRSGVEVPAAEWQKYLYESMLANKPLNELAREILSADGVDPAKRAAAKFYLDRGGETNLLTRDVGRVFFGKDFQCAQCHDHPQIDDYFQADYYGIFAFLNRSFVFTVKKDKKIRQQHRRILPSGRTAM